MKVSKAKIEFPDNCPVNCPKQEKPFYQVNLCCRCPIFDCKGEASSVEPEFYREDRAIEWRRWF